MFGYPLGPGLGAISPCKYEQRAIGSRSQSNEVNQMKSIKCSLSSLKYELAAGFLVAYLIK
jgi:hypothetical protein